MENKMVKLTWLRLGGTFLYILIFPVLLLWLSGDWFWMEGWIFSVWFFLLCTGVILYLHKYDPDLLRERYKQPGEGNQRSWDQWVVLLLVLGFLCWIVIMPLDACRYKWSVVFPFSLKIFGMLALLASSFFFFRSYHDNTFLSPLVRIQEDRKHQLVTTGVYGMVRHPMYLAALLLFMGAPYISRKNTAIGV